MENARREALEGLKGYVKGLSKVRSFMGLYKDLIRFGRVLNDLICPTVREQSLQIGV